MLIGSTQGRLVVPPEGVIQYFPQREWQSELIAARSVGLDYIEWLVERQHNADNPIWTDAGVEEILLASRRAGLIPFSVVNDYIIDHDLATDDGAAELSLRLIERASRLGLRMIVTPLFEASNATAENFERYVPRLRALAEAAAKRGIELTLETVLPVEPLLELRDAIGGGLVSVCVDTGNRAAAGYDLVRDIAALGDFIGHVHIKDKTAEGVNVVLGRGMVDFRTCFKALAKAGYSKSFTFETARGPDPVQTAAAHVTLVRALMTEAGITGGLTSAAETGGFVA